MASSTILELLSTSSFTQTHCGCDLLNMDKTEIREKAAQMKKSLFDQGVLNRFFLHLEYIQERRHPNFVEERIGSYFVESGLYIDELRAALENATWDLRNIERLIMKLKGGSLSMGVTRFNSVVNDMCKIFNQGQMERLYDAFQRVQVEHSILKTQLEPYAELLHMLRDDVPPPAPDDASTSHEDEESTASNDIGEE